MEKVCEGMVKVTKEEVESILLFIRHNKQWVGLQDVDVEAYEIAEDVISRLYSELQELKYDELE